MRLLITGASGLLGLNLSLAARNAHTVIGVDRGRLAAAPFELIQLDLTDKGSIEKALTESGPDAVIHCAAIADVDACEREPAIARRLNTDLPGRISAACAAKGVAMVHISTDAVFDGTKTGSYAETDEPHPTNVYSETKLAGEAAVLAAHSGAIVARVNFYGWSVSGTRSLAEFFVNNLSAGKVVRGFTDVTFCPMLVNDLARVLVRMLEAGLHGLFHAVGPEPMSKYEFGARIARQFAFDEQLIVAESVERAGLTARRAHNLNLSTHKLLAAFGAPLPSFSTGLLEFYTQYQQGYPQQVRSYQQVPLQTGHSGNKGR
jgi:dTDP-4-dehydrorhamnose reductase